MPFARASLIEAHDQEVTSQGFVSGFDRKQPNRTIPGEGFESFGESVYDFIERIEAEVLRRPNEPPACEESDRFQPELLHHWVAPTRINDELFETSAHNSDERVDGEVTHGSRLYPWEGGSQLRGPTLSLGDSQRTAFWRPNRLL